MSSLPGHVIITEVALRDGLQNEDAHVDTTQKEALARQLAATGVPRLEVGAFVRPDKVPQMADSDELLHRIADLAQVVELCAIAPNARGAQRALATEVTEVRLFLSASEGHSQANTGRTVEDGVTAVLEAAAAVRSAGKQVSVGVATAFMCPFDGEIAPRTVARLVRRLAAAGITRFGLADTIGKAHPAQIRQTLQEVRDTAPEVELGLHLHDTYGTGLANAWVGLEEGVTWFDSAAGGTGGCPFAPGAAGNIATEDLVFLCHAAGVRTGVDLDRLNGVVDQLPALIGHGVDSRQARIRSGGQSTANPSR
jgi:hydroxymethylglutaryl-CoA lyase